MKSIYKGIYITNRFFYVGTIVVIVMFLGFFFPALVEIAWILTWALFGIAFFDGFLLFRVSDGVEARRTMAEKLSNGDENKVKLAIDNNYAHEVTIEIIDEVPEQFQMRDFILKEKLKPRTSKSLGYILHPESRGVYRFGSLNIFVQTALGLIKRKYSIEQGKEIPVYPSYIHLDKYDIRRINNSISFPGIKKIRRLGHSMEFEQIKEYVQGDDWRSVNWLATSKTNKLMVNQYTEEKAQSVYCLIDSGRMMRMPFNGLSLLDHSINSSLVISHVVLGNQDKAGLATFSNRIDNKVIADRKLNQMHTILEKLYRVNTDFKESDFGRLFVDIRKMINQHSLIILFTNFDTIDSLRRQMKYLRGISKNHLLIIIFFKNSEMEMMIKNEANDLREVYDKAIAEKFAFEQKLIVNELKKYGILSVLTEPHNLTIDVLNKYLEVKAKGMI